MGDNDNNGIDYISPGGPEIAWHNNWGTAADYSVPAGGCTSWNTNDSCGGWD